MMDYKNNSEIKKTFKLIISIFKIQKIEINACY